MMNEETDLWFIVTCSTITLTLVSELWQNDLCTIRWRLEEILKKFEDFRWKWFFRYFSRFVDFCCSICIFYCVFVFHLCFLIISHHSPSNSNSNLSFQFWIFLQRTQNVSMVFLRIFQNWKSLIWFSWLSLYKSCL